MTYREVGTEQTPVWEYDTKGDTIEGILKRTIEGLQNADGTKGIGYILETKADGEKLIWGTTVLKRRMQSVTEGQQVRITYEGTDLPKIKGHNPTKLFKVEVKE